MDCNSCGYSNIIIVVLLKLVFAIIAIGPMAIEQQHQDIQAITMFAKVPHTLG